MPQDAAAADRKQHLTIIAANQEGDVEEIKVKPDDPVRKLLREALHELYPKQHLDPVAAPEHGARADLGPGLTSPQYSGCRLVLLDSGLTLLASSPRATRARSRAITSSSASLRVRTMPSWWRMRIIC